MSAPGPCRWLTAWPRRSRRERDLDEEMRHHVEALERDYISQGMPRDEARRAARLEFGAAPAFVEETRQAWRGHSAFDLARDAAFGARLMRRHPGLTVTVLLTLGLCLGGNTAILAVLDHFVLRPPPFPAPDRLVDVHSTYAGLGVEDAGSNAYRLGRMEALRDLSVAAVLWSEEWKTVRWGGEVWRLEGWWASDRVVETVGLRPVRGRGFLPDEDHAVILAEAFWREALNARPDVVGRDLVVDEEPSAIVGVAAGLPPGVAYVRVRRFTTDEYEGHHYDVRHDRGGRLWLRLRDGVSFDRVRARLVALDASELRDGPAADHERARKSGFASRVEPVADVRHRALRPRLYLLQAAGLLVLVIGGVNIAGLLAARARARSDEIATRVALGAPRGRLVRQWITESVVLTGAGWAAGLLVAWAMLRHYPRWAGAAAVADAAPTSLLTPGVLLSSLGLAALTALVLGGGTAAQVTTMYGRVTTSGGARATPTRAARRAGARLVSAQTAVAVVLLGVAGLLLHSYARVTQRELGYDADSLLMMRVVLPEDRYPEAADKDRFARRLEESLAAIPGVGAVARTSFVPTFGHPDVALHVSGRDEAREGVARVAFTQVSPGYFAAMGVPILKGRGIEEGDTAWWREAVVVDERLARRVFGDEDPVGRRIRLGSTPRRADAWPVVVGVAADTHHTGWDETDGLPMVYRPIVDSGRGEFSMVLRSRRDPTELQAVVRRAVRDLDPRVPVFRMGTLESFLAESVRPRIVLLNVLGAFAVIAVLLTMLGIAGVLSFDVASRTRELGVRVARGAERGQVAWLVVRQALVRVAWGLGPGLLALYGTGHLVSGLLYETPPADAVVYVAVAGTILAAGLVAGLVPARRAIGLHPVDALRIG